MVLPLGATSSSTDKNAPFAHGKSRGVFAFIVACALVTMSLCEPIATRERGNSR